MSTSTSRSTLHVSLRELLLILFLLGLGLAGLVTSGWLIQLMLAVLAFLTMGLTILAFVGHGRQRAFAVGFIVPVAVYAAAHAYLGTNKLPTTQLLQPLFESIVRREYVDFHTGQVVPNYDPTRTSGFGGGGFAGPPISVREIPDQAAFMTVAHTLLVYGLAYVGGKFALWIHCQRPPPTVS